MCFLRVLFTKRDSKVYRKIALSKRTVSRDQREFSKLSKVCGTPLSGRRFRNAWSQNLEKKSPGAFFESPNQVQTTSTDTWTVHLDLFRIRSREGPKSLSLSLDRVSRTPGEKRGPRPRTEPRPRLTRSVHSTRNFATRPLSSHSVAPRRTDSPQRGHVVCERPLLCKHSPRVPKGLHSPKRTGGGLLTQSFSPHNSVVSNPIWTLDSSKDGARSVAFQNTFDRPHPTLSQPLSNFHGIAKGTALWAPG